MGDPSVFVLLCIPLLLLAGAVLLFVLYPVVKDLFEAADARRVERRRLREETRPDGRPFPPHERGICRRCGVYSEKIYSLSDGQKLCASCYYEYDPWDPKDAPHPSDGPA